MAAPQTTRERLLEVATRMFARRGFGATSVRDIADEAGCNVALISHYFGGKEGLLRETIRAGMRDTGGELAHAAAAPAPADPREQLRGAIDALLRRFDETRDGGLPIVVQELMHPDSPLAQELVPLARANVERLAAILEELARRGQLRDVDPKLAAVLLVGMLQIYFISRAVTDDLVGQRSPELLEKLRDHVIEIFGRGVLRRPAPPRNPRNSRKRGS
jgi:AcrR family transcriptional regulator